MRKRFEQFLLILLTLALVAAPLRGAVALPVPAVADPVSHCDHMQAGMQAMNHASDRHETGAVRPGQRCDHGCAGDCCHGDCGTCAHMSIALPGITVGLAVRYSNFLTAPVTQHFAGHTTHPPFRPPIDLS